MKTITKEATAATAWGKPLRDKNPIKYSYTYSAFAGADELRATGNWPKDTAIVKMVNDKKKSSERTSAMNKALEDAGYEKPTMKNSPLMQLKTVYRALMAGGKHTVESARIAAAKATGIDWPDQVDEEEDDEEEDEAES